MLTGKDVTVESVIAEIERIDKESKAQLKRLRALLKVLEDEAEAKTGA